jgi:hypothetical protein
MLKPMRRWIKEYGRATLLAWDSYAGLVLGGGAGGLTLFRSVRTGAVPVLLAEAAIGVGLAAVVFAAMAIFGTFFDASYRRVLDLAGGFRSALMPYITVCVIAAACGCLGILAALALPAVPTWLAAVLCGVSTWFCGWAVAGTVSITALTLFHAHQRAELMSGADRAETIRAERIRAHR